MTIVRGGPAGPGSGGAAYPNEVETDRSAWWHALGGRQGVIKGLAHTGVAGTMALDFTAGAALVGERAADGTASLDRGYLVWADTTTRVTFGPASASARNDAVVAAFVDTEDGPVGTGALEVGPHIVVVPGVSGTTTPRTDADINGWLGKGGWVRLMDVPIATGSTEIATAGVAVNAFAYQRESEFYRMGGAGQTISSTSAADVVGLSHTTIAVGAMDTYMVDVSLDARHVSGGQALIAELYVNESVNVAQIVGVQASNGNRLTLSKRFRVSGLTPGQHVIKVRAHLAALGGSWEVLPHSTMSVERRRS